MPSKYAEYKKRRLIKLQQRIQELEEHNAKLKEEFNRVYHENNELRSKIYYLETAKR